MKKLLIFFMLLNLQVNADVYINNSSNRRVTVKFYIKRLCARTTSDSVDILPNGVFQKYNLTQYYNFLRRLFVAFEVQGLVNQQPIICNLARNYNYTFEIYNDRIEVFKDNALDSDSDLELGLDPLPTHVYCISSL